MALVHWNPFRELSAFDTPLTRVFRHVIPGTDEVPREWSWVPAVDVYEIDDHALVVTIAGERKVDTEVDRERWYRSERAYGTFRRSFTLPRAVDAGAVTAEHKDGTLRVRLPLKEEAKPHRITVNAA